MPFLPVLSGKSCSPHIAPAKPGPQRVPSWPVTRVSVGWLAAGRGERQEGQVLMGPRPGGQDCAILTPKGSASHQKGTKSPVLVGTRAMRKLGTGDADPEGDVHYLGGWSSKAWSERLTGSSRENQHEGLFIHQVTGQTPPQRTQVSISFRIP